MAARIKFDEVAVGDQIPPLSKVVKREDVKAYADASGDQNPLHQDDAFARSVGFPGIIAHGMFSMAHVAKAVTDWLGDPGALKSIEVQFRAVVYMDETLVARAEVAAKDEVTRRVRLRVWAEVERAGERVQPIKNSEAEVELA
ncbi:MAG TPA: MaoC/PaaZ C-terminal domain-containing protein [Actinomycetota bacterium]